MPALYKEAKAHVVQALGAADSVAITTDGWTSRATQSYVNITACVITADWEMASFVLQTRPLFETHSGVNIAEVLKEAVTEWQLEVQHTLPPERHCGRQVPLPNTHWQRRRQH